MLQSVHGRLLRIRPIFASSRTPVHLAFLWRPTLRDPDDDMVLEAAVNGHAHAIVTFNRRDFSPAMEQFGIAVLSPAMVERLGGPAKAPRARISQRR
jgi:predicted nucleic acid-binding protein